MTLRQAAGAQARRAGVGALRRVFGEPGRAGGRAFRLVCRQGFGNLLDFAFRLFQRPADFFRYLLQFLLHARIISPLGSDQKMSRRMRDLRKNRVLFQASNSIFGPVFWIGHKLPGVANRNQKASYTLPEKACGRTPKAFPRCSQCPFPWPKILCHSAEI